MSKKDYAHYEHAFNTNRTGLDHIDEHVYVKMFGYKNTQDYYDSVSCDQSLQNFYH